MLKRSRKTDLRFEQELEKEYLNYSSQKDRIYIRIAYLVFTVLYALFSIVDYYLLPEWYSLFFAIRFYFVIPVLLSTIILTFLPQYNKWKHWILILSYNVGALGIVFMLIVQPLNILYYGGLFLVFTSGYFMLNLNTESVVLSSLFIMLMLILGIVSTDKLDLAVLSALLFLIAQNILGTMGTYQIERFKRKEFLSIHSLNESQVELNKIVNEKIEEISKAQISTIFALARLAESRDKDTGEHIERVGELCCALSEKLPVVYFKSYEHKTEFIKAIRLASALHDIGKVGISDAILNKPGPLTKDEFKIMKTHVEIGTQTLAKLYEEYPNNAFVQLGIEITQCHHEKWDGTGYPHGISGESIPLSARIMAIIDVYDALINRRSYKKAFDHDTSMRIIYNDSGKHFDPALVKYFEEIFEKR